MQTAQNLSQVKYSDISWQNNVKANFKSTLEQHKQINYSLDRENPVMLKAYQQNTLYIHSVWHSYMCYCYTATGYQFVPKENAIPLTVLQPILYHSKGV
jgi:hypothetical protein